MAHRGRPRKCDPKINNIRDNIRNNDLDTAKATLKEFGIDAEDGDARTALISAAIENNPDFIRWLIGNGANINHQDRIGYSALHFAAQSNLSGVAKLLLDNGANPNLQDIHGNIPLWTAMFNSKLAVSDATKLLLKHKSNYDLVNNYGKTPKFMFETFYSGDISQIDLSEI